jgi:hypothetical protein
MDFRFCPLRRAIYQFPLHRTCGRPAYPTYPQERGLDLDLEDPQLSRRHGGRHAPARGALDPPRGELTVYYNQPYGELYDLERDPGEVDNLWDDPAHAELKADLVMKLLFAEMGKEPLWVPRVAGP